MTRRETFDCMLADARRTRGAAVVGVCNVTPDSFSDGGKYLRPEDARRRVDELVAEGADAVDIGAESTRPGSRPVPAGEQLARMLDVVRYAAGKCCVTVDTSIPEVARACLEAGATAVNDVTCLSNPELAAVVADAGAAFILMHARGSQTEMRGFSVYPEDGYRDVVAEVISEWGRAAEAAIARGLPMSALVMDPGLGFAKSARHSMTLLAQVGALVRQVGVPVLVGASRKSFLRLVDSDASPTERSGASVAAALHAVRAGASLVRVHDVRATRQAIDLSRRMEATP